MVEGIDSLLEKWSSYGFNQWLMLLISSFLDKLSTIILDRKKKLDLRGEDRPHSIILKRHSHTVQETPEPLSPLIHSGLSPCELGRTPDYALDIGTGEGIFFVQITGV